MNSKPWADTPDEDLMKLVQQGHPRALSELYGRYSRKLIRYFHRMLWRDEEKARDFLHDLFVKVIERSSQYDADRKFSTWIYSAAFNMCKNEYRRQGMRAATELTDETDIHVVLQPDIDHHEFQIVLAKTLMSSPEGDRNLFVLRYELDLPLSEIAVITDCPEGTVKSRLFYLKKKLAMQLRVYNPAIK